MPELPMFRNSARTFVEDTVWGNKHRKYIANYGMMVLHVQTDSIMQRARSFMITHMECNVHETAIRLQNVGIDCDSIRLNV